MNATLVEIIKRNFGPYEGDLDPSWGPDQLPAWDSMSHLNMVMDLQMELDIQLEFEEVMAIMTVGDILEAAKKHGVS